jgi:hypothetical protein
MANENIIDLAIDDDIVDAEWSLGRLGCPVPSFEREELGDVAYLARLRELIDEYSNANVVFPVCVVRVDYKDEKEDLDECGICNNPMNLLDDQAAFQCGHFYHAWCLDQWIKIPKQPGFFASCPLCRHEFINLHHGANGDASDDDAIDDEEKDPNNGFGFENPFFVNRGGNWRIEPIVDICRCHYCELRRLEEDMFESDDEEEEVPLEFHPNGRPIAQLRPRPSLPYRNNDQEEDDEEEEESKDDIY